MIGEFAAADGLVPKLDDGVVFFYVARHQLVGFRYANDFRHAGKLVESPCLHRRPDCP